MPPQSKVGGASAVVWSGADGEVFSGWTGGGISEGVGGARYVVEVVRREVLFFFKWSCFPPR